MKQSNFSNSTQTTGMFSTNVAASSVLVICFVLGVPGNIAVIVWLVKWLRRDRRIFTPRLMLSLAASDLMILCCLPLWIWSLIHDQTLSLFLCRFLFYVLYWGHYSSTLCVIVLSIQRYVQVLHPQKWAKLGKMGHVLLLIAVWVLSGVMASYTLVQYKEQMKDGKPWCETDRNSMERVATLIWEVLVFSLAFFLLAYFYFFLYRGVNQTAFFNNPTMSKVLTRIVVAFFVFWIPFVINNILLITAVLVKHDGLFKFAQNLIVVTRALTLINSCVNPFLYAFSALQRRKKPNEDEDS